MTSVSKPKAPAASGYLVWGYRVLALTICAASFWLVGATVRELYTGAVGSTRSAVALAAACVLTLVLPLVFEQRVTAAFRRRDPSAGSVRASSLFVWNAAVLTVLLLVMGTTSRRALYQEGAWPAFGDAGDAGLLGKAGRQVALWVGHRPLGSGCELEAPPSQAAGSASASAAAVSAAAAASSAAAAPSASAPIAAPPPVVPDRDFAPDELFSARSDSVVLVRVRKTIPPESLEAKLLGIEETAGHGSGFLVDAEGLIVTNAHVVDAATSVLVKLRDGRSFDTVELVAFDKARDLALLSLDAEGLSYAPLAEGAVKVGARALAIGNPLGLEHSLTDGIVSAERTKGATRMLQIQTTIAPGSSGGPLFDVRGRVIGVTTATQAAGLNYAVHVDHVRKLLSGARSPKKLQPWRELGVVEDFVLEGPELLPTDRSGLEEGANMVAQAAGSCLRKEGPPTGTLRWRAERKVGVGEERLSSLLGTRPTIDLAGPSKACLDNLAQLVALQLGLALYQQIPDDFRGTTVMRFRVVAPPASGSTETGRSLEVSFEVSTR